MADAFGPPTSNYITLPAHRSRNAICIPDFADNALPSQLPAESREATLTAHARGALAGIAGPSLRASGARDSIRIATRRLRVRPSGVTLLSSGR